MAMIPVECSESKERVVARSDHHSRTRVGQPADLRKTEARSTRQRCKIFAPGLQSGEGLTAVFSALKERAAWNARLRRGACLPHFLAKAYLLRDFPWAWFILPLVQRFWGLERYPSDVYR